jgi:hypothetical protein
MSQIFSRGANTVAPLTIAMAGALVAGGVLTIMGLDRSEYITEVGLAKVQPVQFSHRHHAGQLGIHCAYCHTSVEVSSFAGIPPTHTCMSCHSQIWTTSPMLEPVRQSYQSGQSIEWIRVHDLPDFVYFNHSIHISKGIGCASCHGRVDQMQQIYKAESLQMQWCLDCHRQPERHIRPRDKVYDMTYQPPKDQMELGRRLVAEYKVQKLLDCYTCHR